MTALVDALTLPLEQLVHVVGAVLDRADGHGPRAPELPLLLDVAMVARQARMSALAEVVVARAIADVAGPAELAAAVLVAPCLPPGWWRRPRASDRQLEVQLTLLPVAPPDFVLALLAEAERPITPHTARLLAMTGPFLADAELERARARSRSLPEALRRPVVIALDAHPWSETFWDEVKAQAGGVASPARWWCKRATRALIGALAASPPSEGEVASLITTLAGQLQPASRTSRSHRVTAEPELAIGRAIDPPAAVERQQQLKQLEALYPSRVERRDGLGTLATVDVDAGSQLLELIAPDVDPVRGATSGEAVDRRSSRQEVSLGFATRAEPARPWLGALCPRRWYYLWIEIAPEAVPGALPGGAPLPALAAGAELDVIVFALPGQLHPARGLRRGRLQTAAGRSARVLVPAASPRSVGGTLAAHRLFVPVRAPVRAGPASLRVHVYHRGLLLQSHRVTAWVAPARAVDEPGAGPIPRQPQDRVVDYTLTASLTVERLAAAGHGLSVLLNDDGAGTHSFHVAAGAGFADRFERSASLGEGKLSTLIGFARDELRTMSWGAATGFVDKTRTPYRYATLDHARLVGDLINLARRGYALWTEALAAFGVRGPTLRSELAARLRAPTEVQFAHKQSATHLFPVAVVYDHPLDTNLALSLCPTAEAALRARAPLEEVACFTGACPSYGELDVVCPAGFWGFRHRLGVPLHLGDQGEVADAIGPGSRAILAAISTDPDFLGREAHLEQLLRLSPGGVTIAADRDSCLKRLRGPSPGLIYFYCHGGVTGAGRPFLELGTPHSAPLTADNLTAYEVWWGEPPDVSRPLVILNGCHTTALSPEASFDLVTGFVVQANAAGVIGTEITIFVELATVFGEALVSALMDGEPVGAAVRRARLTLLRQGNPLGLVYIPFALATAALAP